MKKIDIYKVIEKLAEEASKDLDRVEVKLEFMIDKDGDKCLELYVFHKENEKQELLSAIIYSTSIINSQALFNALRKEIADYKNKKSQKEESFQMDI